MTAPDAVSFRDRYVAIERALDVGVAVGERDAVRADIIALFRALEQSIADLSAAVSEQSALRDEVKRLVDKFKTTQAESNAPQFHAERPVVRADHIGASTFAEKGWSLLSLGDYEGAETALNRALELSPDDPQSEALLGWAQMLQTKHDDALLTFQKVLMRQPANAIARINVGYICLKKRIFGEAIEHLSKAIRLDNDKKATLYAHFYLGLTYLEREMYQDAQTFFEKTIVIGPNLIEAYYELGRAYWFNRQFDEAKSTWSTGHAANKFNPWGRRCAEVLQTVEAGGQPPRAD